MRLRPVCHCLCVEVTPPSRLVWTNDEGDEGGAVTTVTFEEKRGGETLVVLHDLYSSNKLSTMQSPPEVQAAAASSSSSWISFSSPRKRAWDGHKAVELAG